MQITGQVHEIGAEQQITDTFKKRELIVIVADNPQYPEHIKVEATNDRVNLFDNLDAGDAVTVDFNLRGRPWTNKDGVTTYFNTLVAWKVSKGAQSNQPAHNTPPPVDISAGDEEDDLPF